MAYLQWIPAYGGQVPPGAEPAGRDQDGATLYAGRALHENEMIPAKVKPGHGALLAWGGSEHIKHQYEVLVSYATAWKFSRDGNVPNNSISVGRTNTGEELFMGRGFHEGTLTPGKVHRSHGCLYISYGGQEISIKEYEVLIQV